MVRWPFGRRQEIAALREQVAALAARAEEAAALRAEVEKLRAQLSSGDVARAVSNLSGAVDEVRSLVGGDLARGDGRVSKHPVYQLYAYHRGIIWATEHNPEFRPGTRVSTITLRDLAAKWDVLRSCIEQIKRENDAIPGRIVAADGYDEDDEGIKEEIARAEEFFSMEGGLGQEGTFREAFEAIIIEDLLVVGVAALWLNRDRKGRVIEVIPIDSTTIRPLVDEYGWPGPGDDWYEQWADGKAVRRFKRNELIWHGLHYVSYDPYPKSPVEWLIPAATSGLSADRWNRERLTKGTTPADMLTAPEGWTPEQIIKFSEWFDGVMSGDITKRVKTKWVPHGTERLSATNDSDYTEMELWMLRRCCALYGVSPASIGFAGEQYKVSQEGSMRHTTQFGVGRILAWKASIYNVILRAIGCKRCQWKNIQSAEETPNEVSSRLSSQVSGGLITINEARAELGRRPMKDCDFLFAPQFAQTLEAMLVQSQQAIDEARNPEPEGDGEDAGGPEPFGLDQLVAGEGGGQSQEQPDEAPPGAGGGAEQPFAPFAPAQEEEQAGGGGNGRAALAMDLAKWERKAVNRLARGRNAACLFASESIPEELAAIIGDELADCTDAGQVHRLFDEVRDQLEWLERGDRGKPTGFFKIAGKIHPIFGSAPWRRKSSREWKPFDHHAYIRKKFGEGATESSLNVEQMANVEQVAKRERQKALGASWLFLDPNPNSPREKLKQVGERLYEEAHGKEPPPPEREVDEIAFRVAHEIFSEPSSWTWDRHAIAMPEGGTPFASAEEAREWVTGRGAALAGGDAGEDVVVTAISAVRDGLDAATRFVGPGFARAYPLASVTVGGVHGVALADAKASGLHLTVNPEHENASGFAVDRDDLLHGVPTYLAAPSVQGAVAAGIGAVLWEDMPEPARVMWRSFFGMVFRHPLRQPSIVFAESADVGWREAFAAAAIGRDIDPVVRKAVETALDIAFPGRKE